MKFKKFFRRKKKKYKKESPKPPKLKNLQGIAGNAVQVDSHHNPVYDLNIPFDLEVNLISGKIKPDRKGDDIEKTYNVVKRWFHESLEKERIPLNMIKSAKIIVKRGKRPICIIKTEKKTYKSK